MKIRTSLHYTEEEWFVEFGYPMDQLYIKGYEIREIVCPKCDSTKLRPIYKRERDASDFEPTHACQYRSYFDHYKCTVCGWEGKNPKQLDIVCRVISSKLPALKEQELNPELDKKFRGSGRFILE